MKKVILFSILILLFSFNFVWSKQGIISIPESALKYNPVKEVIPIEIQKVSPVEIEQEGLNVTPNFSKSPYSESGHWCKNLCGDGICQEVTCMAIGCPCPETLKTCPEDCSGSKDLKQKCAPEGEKIYFGKPSCCSGLVPIPVMELINNTCVGAGDGSSYCTKCGDGICKKPENECNCPSDCKGGVQVTPSMPNPAAVYCKDLGYKYEIREDPKTKGQYGVCIFPDGSECDGWAFYRGECGKKWQKENKEKCAREGERVNRNPLLGSTNKKCCFGLTEIRISKSYSVCVNCGDDLCKWPEDEFNCPSDCKENKPVFCDAFHKCPFGEECYSFQDQKHPICWKGDPCKRCIGECKVLESYPPKVICEKGIRLLSDSGKPVVIFPPKKRIVVDPKREKPILIEGEPVEFKGVEENPDISFEVKAKEKPVSVKIGISPEKKRIEIKVKDKVAITKEMMKFEENKLKIKTPKKEIEVNVLPDEAIETVQEEIPEVRESELKVKNDKPVYEIRGEKRGRLLFIFPVRINLLGEVNAQTAEILKIKKPWWSFLVF